jgi:hypothetical protein
MGGTVLRRRGHRRLPHGLLGAARLRPATFKPVDHMTRLSAAASKGSGAEPLTLDDVIAGAWQALGGSKAVRCPLCCGEMWSGGSVGAYADAEEEPKGECVDCGTQLL